MVTKKRHTAIDNSYSLLAVSLILYAWGTQLYNIFPISPNVIVGFVIVFALLAVLSSDLTNKLVLYICFCALMLLYSTLATSDFSENFSVCIRVITLVLFFALVGEKKESVILLVKAFDRFPKLIKYTAVLFSVLTYFELLLSSCYISGLEKGGWGSGSFFVGFTTSPHMAASNALLLMAIIFLYFRQAKHSWLDFALVFAPTLAILQSGARVYLVPLAAMFVAFYVYRLRGQKLTILILPMIAFLVIVLFFQTGMFSKFLAVSGNSTAQSEGFFFAFTNSRTWMWDSLVSVFTDGSIVEKLFGYGFTLSEDATGKTAHNDLLFMLLSAGVIGLLVYVMVLFNAFRTVWLNYIGSQPFRYLLLISVIAFTAAPVLLNGLYNNQHLVFANIIFLGVIASKSKKKANLVDMDIAR